MLQAVQMDPHRWAGSELLQQSRPGHEQHQMCLRRLLQDRQSEGAKQALHWLQVDALAALQRQERATHPTASLPKSDE